MAELSYPGLHPSDPQNNPSNAVGRKIRLRLKQEVQSQWLERKLKWVECCRNAYDIYAKELLDGNERVDDSFLDDFIPQLVFRVAIDFRWISLARLQSNPVKRTGTGRWRILGYFEGSDAWIDRSRTESWWGSSRQSGSSEPELKENWADVELRKGTGAWFKGFFRGRIEYWQATMPEQGPVGRVGKHEAPKNPSLKSRRGRKKGSGSQETRDLNIAIRAARKDGEKTTDGILNYLARRASQMQVPLPGGWRDKYNVKSWKEVRSKTSTDARLLQLCRNRFSKVKA